MDATQHYDTQVYTKIQANPKRTAMLIGALVLVIIVVIIFPWVKAKLGLGSKSGYTSNMSTGGNNPLWWHGSGDAGKGGSVDRSVTTVQASHYHPAWHRDSKVNPLTGTKEGMTEPVPAPQQVHWGQYALGADGGFGSVSNDSCNLGWDPAAVAEAQALGSVGSYPHTHAALAPLQDAVDAGVGLHASSISDSDLAQLAQTGGIA